MNRNTALTLAGLATGALIAVGCGGGSEPGVTKDAGTQPAGSGTADAKPGNKPAVFGKQTKTLDGGIVVSTKVPDLFTPSALSAGHKAGNKAYKVTVTIKNTGDEPVDLTLVQMEGTMGAEGTTCERVFSSDSGLTDFDGMIQPGKSKSATAGFSCASKDTSTVGVQVSIGFDSTVADFEGKPTK